MDLTSSRDMCALCWIGNGLAFLENRQVSHDAEFIFVGTQSDADCTIIHSGEYCILVDTGEDVDAPAILRELQERNISQIDCLILTHPDQDHVGGAAALIDTFKIREVIVPYYVGEKHIYNTLINTLQQKRIPIYTMARARQLVFGDLNLMIFPPEDFYYSQSNDYSLAIMAKHGDTTLFFAGDAEEKRIRELLKLELPSQVSLYKVARHGRYDAESVALIKRLSPEIAVITASQADPEIDAALHALDAVIYYTVQSGARFVSDGMHLYPQSP